MLLAAGAAYAMTPRSIPAGNAPGLAMIVPKAFAGWRLDERVSPLLPDEQTQATIDRFYDETLARTYFDGQGRSIMLVIAYGARQDDRLRAHQPEICYSAQGFEVRTLSPGLVRGPFGMVPTERMFAVQDGRTEAVVYWLTIGGTVTRFGMQQKLQQIMLGLRGKIPEGFLVRASLIGPDDPAAYAALEQFLGQLLSAIPSQARQKLAGV